MKYKFSGEDMKRELKKDYDLFKDRASTKMRDVDVKKGYDNVKKSFEDHKKPEFKKMNKFRDMLKGF